MKPVLIVKVGRTLPEIARGRGDYELWIARGLGLADAGVRVVDVVEGEALPDLDAVSGIVITGSASMVSAREPWSESTADWLRPAVASGPPILGLCYGHQLLAHALGGVVGTNPSGREIGTVEVRLEPAAAADPLFGGLPNPLVVQATHVEAVLELPASATRLASSRLDPNHAFRVGEAVWGVQFHPEFDAEIVRGYIAGRRDQLLAEGLDPATLAANVRELGHGRLVLRRFAGLLAARPSPA